MYPAYDPNIGVSPREESSEEQYYLQRNVRRLEWYEPPHKSLPVSFCLDTSLHGLKYLGQSKRHLCERIFWLTAFTASGITAMVLIWGLWVDFRDTPIITVFNPTEIRMDKIPFPSVTVCNVNNIRKGKVEEYKRLAEKAVNGEVELPEEDLLKTFAKLVDINHICAAANTFTQRLRSDRSIFNELNSSVSNEMLRRREEFDQFIHPVKTLGEGSQPCSEMILFCIWLDEIQNCSSLFQEIDTDYGYCCTFNTVPMSILMKHANDERDDPQRVEEWREEDITTDNLLFTQETFGRRHPRRQKYPGRPAGLSILLDPDLHEYYCSNTDSEGFVVALNLPLDFPRMKDNGIAVRTNSEVFISAVPSVTFSDDSVKSFSLEHRQCYFGKEWILPHYSIYTVGNCMDECISNQTMARCGCNRYYMPGGYVVDNLCTPQKYNCTESVRRDIITKGMEEACSHCLPPCTEIGYTAETTFLPIREDYIDALFKEHTEIPRPDQVSIMHVYINVDSIFPRLRQEFTTKTQLISNAGGLLGICMGFSVLSLLEILYYCSIRLACRYNRRKSLDESENLSLKENDSQSLARHTDLAIRTPGSHARKKSWFKSAFKRQSVVDTVEEPSAPPYMENFEVDFRRTCYGLALIEEMNKSKLKKQSGRNSLNLGYYSWDSKSKKDSSVIP